MIKLVGLALFAPAAWFLYKAITAPSIRLGKAVQLMPLYGILFFVTVAAIAVLTIGAPRAMVYVHGAPEDASSYNSLAAQLGSEYKIGAFDTFGKPAGIAEAVSCNRTALNAFVETAEKKSLLAFAKKMPPNCDEMSAIAGFVHPRIDVYFR